MAYLLQSLWTGDRSMYRWGKRQPVRRRRGDVHGDLSAIVLRLAWNGELPSLSPFCPLLPVSPVVPLEQIHVIEICKR